ncbi:MAG: YbjQ family protein [Epsilonproteobacteria bacterium]|nr:YbjQ family protein [Campylobacterota bacterium]
MYDIIIFLTLLFIGYIVGNFLEKRHYKSIRKREEETLDLPLIMLKKPLNDDGIYECKLVSGSVVISIDYFKKFIAYLINIFGGSIGVYETLLDRARREAILRMKEDAKGASEIINLRIETSSISKNSAKSVGSVEIIAYATAIYRR